MANPLHVAKLLELSAEDWNAWRFTSKIKPDLRDAVLSDPNPDWALRGIRYRRKRNAPMASRRENLT